MADCSHWDSSAAPPTTAEINICSSAYSGAGGLSSTAEDYVAFAQVIVNGGRFDGKRLVSPRTIELMSSADVPDTLPGRPRGEGFGRSAQLRWMQPPVAEEKRLKHFAEG